MRALIAPPTRSRALRLSCSLLALALIAVALRAAPLRADEPLLRLRIAWGGGAERIWRGKIWLDSGRLAEPQPLGVEADEPGSMWLDDAGAIVIRQRSPRGFDGLDLEVRAADLKSHLFVVLSAPGEPVPEPKVIELSSLLKDLYKSSLDAQNNRLLVGRSPGDDLRVTVISPSLVFGPGDRLILRVQPHLLSAEYSGPLSIKWQLFNARGKRELSSSEQQLSLPAPGQPDIVMPLEFKVPSEQGAYDLVLTASREDQTERLLALGKRREVLAERKIQFVVIRDARAKQPDDPPPSTELMTINPAKTWWDRVAHLPRMAGLGKEPLEHGRVERWDHPQLGPMVSLSAGAAAGNGVVDGDGEAWVAYPLSVSEPGQVHVVEVEYPSDVPQAMSISIIEPNAAGVVVPVGLDSGVYVPPEAAESLAQSQWHRLVFWPRTREPWLLISCGSGSARAVHGRIRLLGPRKFGVGGLRLGLEARSGLPRVALPEGSAGSAGRLVAGYLDRPLFPQNFGASQDYDTWSGRSLDDWVTFYEGATRLLEYADYVGYNALVVSVLADGSTIYPSQHLAPTPRYDTGTFFSTGQDPIRKDVLEMLLRLADQDGQTVIPLVDFSAPLVELEADLRRGGADAVGLEPVGASGATWLAQNGAERGLAAYYNPLDPRVQEALRRVVRELVERYAHHRSFGGVALGSSSRCSTLLPGVEWSLDDVTMARFARETNVTLPPDDGPRRFAERAKLLAGPNREAWLGWRAEVLHRFHQRLRDDLTAGRSGAKLIVDTEGMLESPGVERLLRPALPGRAKIEELPLAVGIRPELYQGDEGIVVLRPYLIAAPLTLKAQAIELQTTDAPELNRDFASSGGGSLFVHAPLRTRLASFDRQSPFGAEQTYCVLAAQLAPGGPENRRRFVQALAGLDSTLLIDGGSMLTLGQEESLAPLLAAFRRLPAAAFQTVGGDGQGLAVRTLTRDSATYLWVVNPLRWKCHASLAVRGSETATLTELSGQRQIGQLQGGRLSFDLEPYDMVAVRFSAPDVGFSGLEVEFPVELRGQLQKRIRDLVTRAAVLGEPTRIPALANPDFELPSSPGHDIPGWVLAGARGSAARLDGNEKHGGAHSARISSGGGVASLISDPFDAPRTGRISFSVWLRASGDGPAAPLRLALGGRLHGADYYRFALAPAAPEWEHFIFQVDDLPLSGLSDLQIRFDLMGAGQVWVDDIVVSDLTFSPNERTELSRLITRAQFSLDADKLAEAARLMDGYWPHFLEENVPLPKTVVASNPNPALPPPPSIAPEPAAPWWRRGWHIFK